jgi:hypothetical protein
MIGRVSCKDEKVVPAHVWPEAARFMYRCHDQTWVYERGRSLGRSSVIQTTYFSKSRAIAKA